MNNAYKVLVHYNSVKSPIDVAAAVLCSWKKSGRPPLRLVDDKKCVDFTDERLKDILTFHTDDETVCADFRSTAKKDADSVELLFTNPKWKYQKSINSCAVYLAADSVQRGQSGYSQDSLLSLLTELVELGEVRSAVLDSTNVLYCDAVDTFERKRAKSNLGKLFPTLLYWMTFVPAEARAKVLEYVSQNHSEVRLLSDHGKKGLIVSVGNRLPIDEGTHIDMLTKVNKELGLI